ncbi:type II secretion system F family protein [Candidatus Parcubacteria bacterium]|nr:MAG: type II secretion system F family protein [Candidatus Parcubacteria bacterium]
MLYAFRAVDRTGKTISETRDSASERELADALRSEGFLLLEATPQGTVAPGKRRGLSLPMFLSRVTLVERMVFARNLAVMVGAGLSLTRALEALEEQSTNQKFRTILADIRESVTRGVSFADSLRPHERVFGPIFISMIESGEISGNLEKVLKTLAKQMKRDHDLRSRVKGALIYPAIVIGALVVIGMLMMIYVVPTLTQTFAELEIDLPLTTKIVIGASNIFLQYYYLVLIAGAALVLGAWYALRLPSVRLAFDSAILRVPLFGPLIQKLNSARFARTLSSLIGSGTPITRALEVTAAVLGNHRFRQSLEGAAAVVQQGKPLSDVLKKHPELYPPLVTEMLQVGEETGATTSMLLRLALFYEEEVTATTKNMSSVIEPVLMIVIGAIVGFFAISMIQPIYGGLGGI